MEKTKILCLEEIKKTPSIKMDGVSFENIVFAKMCLASKGTKFYGTIRQTGKQTFPDIIANQYYGIEVKVTAEDKWISTGNSVAEGTRVEETERIYMFFGKLGGSPNIIYRPYQDCLYEVAVTHSPRYKIDMELPLGQSIFNKLNLDYDSLRKDPKPILKFKEHYRSLLKPGEELWWIDPGMAKNDQPIVRFLNKFDEKEESDFIIKSMIFFPEIFGNNNKTKFERVAAFLLNDYNAITHNLRDFFTAGGQVGLKVSGKKIMVPQIFALLFEKAKLVTRTIDLIPQDKLLEYWKLKNIGNDRIEAWKSLLNKSSDSDLENCKASEIFESGLE